MGHGHESYTIPDYRIYKVEDVPLLMTTKRALAAQGLHDPWLRNEVWRYDPKYFGTEGLRLRRAFGTGIGVGFAAFIITVVGTAIYDRANPPKHDHDHGHH